MLLPTVKITYRKNGAYGRINEADFDPAVHKLFEEPAAKPVEPPPAPTAAPAPAPAPAPTPPPPAAPTPDSTKRGPGRPRKNILED